MANESAHRGLVPIVGSDRPQAAPGDAGAEDGAAPLAPSSERAALAPNDPAPVDTLSPYDFVVIAAKAGCDPRTVRRVLAPTTGRIRSATRSTTRARVIQAAVDLGYVLIPSRRSA